MDAIRTQLARRFVVATDLLGISVDQLRYLDMYGGLTWEQDAALVEHLNVGSDLAGRARRRLIGRAMLLESARMYYHEPVEAAAMAIMGSVAIREHLVTFGWKNGVRDGKINSTYFAPIATIIHRMVDDGDAVSKINWRSTGSPPPPHTRPSLRSWSEHRLTAAGHVWCARHCWDALLQDAVKPALFAGVAGITVTGLRAEGPARGDGYIKYRHVTFGETTDPVQLWGPSRWDDQVIVTVYGTERTDLPE